MKFLVDVGIGKKVENLLRGNGHNVLSVLDDNPQASDAVILNEAAVAKRIVVTMDKILVNWFSTPAMTMMEFYYLGLAP